MARRLRKVHRGSLLRRHVRWSSPVKKPKKREVLLLCSFKICLPNPFCTLKKKKLFHHHSFKCLTTILLASFSSLSLWSVWREKPWTWRRQRLPPVLQNVYIKMTSLTQTIESYPFKSTLAYLGFVSSEKTESNRILNHHGSISDGGTSNDLRNKYSSIIFPYKNNF